MTIPSPIQRISVDQARDLLGRSNVLGLDTRDPVAFKHGRIGSAARFSSDTVIPILSRTPKSTPTLIYCYHGKASLEYARMFADFGFAKFYSLDEGFEAWQQAETDAAPPAPLTVLGEATRTWLVSQGFSTGNLTARADGMTPLMVAARLGNTAVAAELLSTGASLDTRNADGNTALWMACVGGASEVIDLLLSSSSDLNIQNDNGGPPA